MKTATITQQVARVMQEILNDVAKRAGNEEGFVKRQSPIDGEVFVKTVVLSVLNNGSPSLSEMVSTANILGVTVTPQGLDQRFSKEASNCLKKVLEEAVKKVIGGVPGVYPILDQFNEIYIQDSTIIQLPDELRELWRGIGGHENTSGSALKIQFRFELKTGVIDFFELTNGRANDQGAKVQDLTVANSALSLADLGYWNVKRFGRITKDKGYFLSRIKTDTNIYHSDGTKIELADYLKKSNQDEFDIDIILSKSHQLKCRFIGRRVPVGVSKERRRKLNRNARQHGLTPSQRQLALCDWTIVVTNIPKKLLSVEQVLVLIHVRWQVELVFKFWKSDGCIDKSRSKKIYHILCNIYGKLIAVIFKHWALLCSNWRFLYDSLFKAGKEIQSTARLITYAINDFEQLCKTLSLIALQLDSVCKISKRKKRPSTIQRLKQVDNRLTTVGALA